jgi:hypothetical protein
MGSIVTLGLGRLEVDWGKNSHYANHSKLFLPSDKKHVVHFYGDPDSEGVIEKLKPGLARPLRSVKRRLELLGYTMAAVRRQYEEAVATMPDGYEVPATSFDLFAKTLAVVDVQNIALDPFFADHSLGDFAARSILGDPEFTKTAENLKGLSRWDGQFFENLDPYALLRLLAENTANLDLEVQWRYADLIDDGWAEEESMFEALSATDRWLVVTEGSSDGHIIRKALELLRPDITDFFDFVDMSENYPFTGTGNLFRFCQGLAQIRIQNKVLVIFDNDAAGREIQHRVVQLPLPSNMRVVRLPDLPACRRFPTVGPNGQAEEDINGRAVSIELFLDLRAEELPCVRWTAYNSSTESYQGELLRKEFYTKQFMEARTFGAKYDTSKLEGLLDHIFNALTNPG